MSSWISGFKYRCEQVYCRWPSPHNIRQAVLLQMLPAFMPSPSYVSHRVMSICMASSFFLSKIYIQEKHLKGSYANYLHLGFSVFFLILEWKVLLLTKEVIIKEEFWKQLGLVLPGSLPHAPGLCYLGNSNIKKNPCFPCRQDVFPGYLITLENLQT